MKMHLDNELFVKSDYTNLVYKVDTMSVYDYQNYFTLHLSLFAGWDYVNPDENDIQGWCPANMFAEEWQYEMINVYFYHEGINECLEANGYEIVEKPKLQR